MPPGPWSDHLAANPDLKEKFAALVQQFHAEVPRFKSEVANWTRATINMAEHGRQIGIAVIELEEMFAGKKLTVDFWQQIEPLFVDPATGLKITKEQLQWFAKVARNHLDPITEVSAARAMMQPLLLASGDDQFQLQGERAPQVAHAKPVPLLEFKALFDVSTLEERWKRLKSDGTTFVDGRVREDLCPVLREELRPAIEMIEEIKRAVGL